VAEIGFSVVCCLWQFVEQGVLDILRHASLFGKQVGGGGFKLLTRFHMLGWPSPTGFWRARNWDGINGSDWHVLVSLLGPHALFILA